MNKNKIVKGYELMTMIAEKQIKSGTKFKDLTDDNYADNSNMYRYENNNFIGRWGGTNILNLLNHDFEIIEDEEIKIDIQSIKVPTSMEVGDECGDKTMTAFLKIQRALFELTLAVKQLDKKINKED